MLIKMAHFIFLIETLSYFDFSRILLKKMSKGNINIIKDKNFKTKFSISKIKNVINFKSIKDKTTVYR